MSLLKGLLILFIFSKNLLLDLLILRIVLLLSMPFNFAMKFVISFLTLALAVFVVVPGVLVGVGLVCLFELFLYFLCRPVLLRTSLSGLPSLCPISFGLL